MSLNGKTGDIHESDLFQFGKTIGFSSAFCKRTLEKIKTVLADWPQYAEKADIDEERMSEIVFDVIP